MSRDKKTREYSEVVMKQPGFAEVVLERWACGDVYVLRQRGDRVHLGMEGVRRLIEVLGEELGREGGG